MPNVPVNPQTRPTTDPALQKRWAQELEKRRNWLLENAATLNQQGGKTTGSSTLSPDDLPRFSQPGAGIGLNGAVGERYLRATEDRRPTDGGRLPFQAGLDPANPTADQAELDTQANGGQTRAEAVRTVPFATLRSEDPAASATGRDGSPGRATSGLFSEGGAFTNPLRNPIDDAGRIASEERSASLDRLLSGPAVTSANGASAATAGMDPSNVNALGLAKSPMSRAQTFESLLSGTAPAGPAATVFGNPLSPSAVAKATLVAGPERNAASALAPITAPTAPRPSTPRIEPRPAVLQLPKMGL